MTRKDYILIADTLKRARTAFLRQPGPLRGVDHAADILACELARDNPRFDRERFLKACGTQS